MRTVKSCKALKATCIIWFLLFHISVAWTPSNSALTCAHGPWGLNDSKGVRTGSCEFRSLLIISFQLSRTADFLQYFWPLYFEPLVLTADLKRKYGLCSIDGGNQYIVKYKLVHIRETFIQYSVQLSQETEILEEYGRKISTHLYHVPRKCK